MQIDQCCAEWIVPEFFQDGVFSDANTIKLKLQNYGYLYLRFILIFGEAHLKNYLKKAYSVSNVKNWIDISD